MEDNRRRSRLPVAFLNYVGGPLGDWYPALEKAPRIFRGKALLQRLGQDPMEGYLARITIPRSVRASLFSDDLENELQGYDSLDQLREQYHRADT